MLLGEEGALGIFLFFVFFFKLLNFKLRVCCKNGDTVKSEVDLVTSFSQAEGGRKGNQYVIY